MKANQARGAVERHEKVAHLLDEVGGRPLAFAGGAHISFDQSVLDEI